MTPLDVTSRKLLSLHFTLPFDLRIQLRRGWPIQSDDWLRLHLHNFRLGRRSDLSWSDGVPLAAFPQVNWWIAAVLYTLGWGLAVVGQLYNVPVNSSDR